MGIDRSLFSTYPYMIGGKPLYDGGKPLYDGEDLGRVDGFL